MKNHFNKRNIHMIRYMGEKNMMPMSWKKNRKQNSG